MQSGTRVEKKSCVFLRKQLEVILKFRLSRDSKSDKLDHFEVNIWLIVFRKNSLFSKGSKEILFKPVPECIHLVGQFGTSKLMTRFQLILPVHSQNVTKNLTAHRMHVAGPQINQIYRQTNSFQNMYGML